LKAGGFLVVALGFTRASLRGFLSFIGMLTT
jgi:hypothetical protein